MKNFFRLQFFLHFWLSVKCHIAILNPAQALHYAVEDKA